MLLANIVPQLGSQRDDQDISDVGCNQTTDLSLVSDPRVHWGKKLKAVVKE